MEKSFMFVNGTHADKSSKKLIRRHVMKGKNAGKTLHRSSRLALEEARRRPDLVADGVKNNFLRTIFQVSLQNQNEPWVHLSKNTFARSLGNVFLPFSLPMEISPHSLQTINEFFVHVTERLYPIRLGLAFHEMKLMWLRVLCLDTDAFTCSMYMMQACNELFTGNGSTSPTALHHISKTFAAVTKRLQGREALSDSTVAIILSLIHQEQMRDQQAAAKVHLKGLGKIIELRGGIEHLEAGGNTLLVLKVCKADVMFAIQYGGSTMFFRDRMPDLRNMLANKGVSLYSKITPVATIPLDPATSRLHPDLQIILADAKDISSLFNVHLRSRTIDCLTFIEISLSLFYRLLHFGTLNEPLPESPLDAVYQTALMAFVMTMFVQKGRRSAINYGLISTRLADIHESKLRACDDELALWVVIMGGIWQADEVDQDWLCPKIRALARRLEIEDWGKAKVVLGRFPWLGALHDEPGRELWDRAHRSR